MKLKVQMWLVMIEIGIFLICHDVTTSISKRAEEYISYLHIDTFLFIFYTCKFKLKNGCTLSKLKNIYNEQSDPMKVSVTLF